MPRTIKKAEQALLYCETCDFIRRRTLPTINAEDDADTSAWRIKDLWPQCCGSDLRLMELLPR
jgi:hypothetical protein